MGEAFDADRGGQEEENSIQRPVHTPLQSGKFTMLPLQSSASSGKTVIDLCQSSDAMGQAVSCTMLEYCDSPYRTAAVHDTSARFVCEMSCPVL
jgi:hypothetical protein